MSTLTETELRERFPNASEAFLRANFYTANAGAACVTIPTRDEPAKSPAPKKRIRQSAKPLLNKLETEWRDYLRGQYPDAKIYEQAFRFRLANGLHYTPDLALWVEGRLTCWECKGPHSFRGGFENLKSAANRYQEIDWRLCWKVDGEWCTQEVLP